MEQVSLSALFQKKSAELSGGYYARGNRLDPANRSNYNQLARIQQVYLSMSIIQAILATLSLHMESFQYSQSGAIGTVWCKSTSRPGMGSTLCWDMRDPARSLLGGFVNGLTYQVVMLHLLWCLLTERVGRPTQPSEVGTRWRDLLITIEQSGFRRETPGGWSREQVAMMCWYDKIQPHIERVADALWFSLRYQIPNRNLDRQLLLSPQDLPLPAGAWDASGSVQAFLVLPSRVSPIPSPRRSPRQVRLTQPLVTGDEWRKRLEVAQEMPGGRGKRQTRVSDEWTIAEKPDWFI